MQGLPRSRPEREAFVDAVTYDPGDLASGANEGNAIAVAGGDLGVDEDVLELLFAAETEGTQTVARAAGADGEFVPG